MTRRALPSYIRPLFNQLISQQTSLLLDNNGAHLPGISLLIGGYGSEAGQAWEADALATYQLDSWDTSTGEAYTSSGSGEITGLNCLYASSNPAPYGQEMPTTSWLWQVHMNEVSESLRTFLLAAPKKYTPKSRLAGIRWIADPNHRNKIRLLASDQHRVHEVVLPARWQDDFSGGAGWLHPAMSLALARKELVNLQVHPENVAVASFAPKSGQAPVHLVTSHSAKVSAKANPEDFMTPLLTAGIGGEGNEVVAALDELTSRVRGKVATQGLVWVAHHPLDGLSMGVTGTGEHLPLVQVSGNSRFQVFNIDYLRGALAPFAGAKFYLAQGEASSSAALLTVQGAPVRALLLPVQPAQSLEELELGAGEPVFDPAGHGPRF